jgi:hypothetical protein
MNRVCNRKAVGEQSPGLLPRLPWVNDFNQPQLQWGCVPPSKSLPNVAAARQRWAMVETASRYGSDV